MSFVSVRIVFIRFWAGILPKIVIKAEVLDIYEK